MNKNEFQAAAAAAAQLYFCAQFSCTDFDLLNLTAGAPTAAAAPPAATLNVPPTAAAAVTAAVEGHKRRQQFEF